MQQTIKNEDGTFLVELAITLIILGLITAGAVQYYEHVKKSLDYNQTRERVEAVSIALSNHVQTRFRLPCPAEPDPNLLAGAAFGTERAACNGAGQHGIVPYRTLGLPEHYALDGYGNYITYVVSPSFTTNNTLPAAGTPINVQVRLLYKLTAQNIALAPKALFCGGNGAIANDLDVDQGGDDTIDTGRSVTTLDVDTIPALPDTNYFRGAADADNFVTAPALAIISHGENGWGAYSKNGTQITPGGALNSILGDDEEVNAVQDNAIDISRTVNDVQNATEFDDIITIFTQEQILGLAGGGSCEEL